MTQSPPTGELVARLERAETDLAYAKQALDRATARAIKFGKDITTLERELEEAVFAREDWQKLATERHTALTASQAEVERLKEALRQVVLLADLFDVSDKTPEDALYIIARQQKTWAAARAALQVEESKG